MQPSPFMDRPLIVLNPAANRGKMGHLRELACARAGELQAEYVETHQTGEATELARKAAHEGRAVIAIGGDGTVHEVVNGLLAVAQRVPLGIVAAGSGNDFAWNTLKLPRDPVAAFERAFHGTLTDVDAGQVNGHFFANAFSIGLDADIGLAAQQLKIWPLMSGSRLYTTAALKQLLFGYHRCPWLSFKLDQGAWQEKRRFVLLAVSNGPTYGAGFRINPAADPVDGLFDICAVDYISLLRAMGLLPVMRKGEHISRPMVHIFRAKAIQVVCQASVNMQMDGEGLCESRYQAEILPGALWIRV